MNRFMLASLLFFGAASAAFAQVTVQDPWVRATVPQQTSTGAFMRLNAVKDSRLLEARSPLADSVQIHEMTMSGNVMKMHAVHGIDLPAGKTVDLASGGYHIMLTGLKKQMKEGDTVPITLVVAGKDGKRETVEVSAPVLPLGSPGPMKMHGH